MFPKQERLCGQLRIKQLYQEGRHFVCWPLRVTYRLSEDDTTQVVLWAPKSIFKHAVDRNRMRRLMREAYRLNKHILEETCPDKHYQLAMNYIDREQQPYPIIEKAMRKTMKRLAGAGSENS